METPAKQMDDYLAEYTLYGEVFSKQLYMPEIWVEHTGCSIDDYAGYITCCMTRLYDFKTWYEHSYATEYPGEWMEMADHKYTPQIFRA